MLELSWMAWTTPTALFFITIAVLLLLMGLWEYHRPGGDERMGILRIVTTRGDRLFISLVCAAYIHLAWLFFTNWHLGWAMPLSLAAAFFIFKRV